MMQLEQRRLADLQLSPEAPRVILAFVQENENGILRSLAQDLMALTVPHGFTNHVIDLCGDGWVERLRMLLERGVLLAWGWAGIGSQLKAADRVIWDAIRVPFISVMADSPCLMPKHHRVASDYVANGYIFRDWFDMQRKLIRSPQLSAMLPHGVPGNPDADKAVWSARRHRMVFVKTGCDPAQHRSHWAKLPPRFRAVIEDAAALALKRGIGDISGAVLQSFEHHGLYAEQRPDILFGLMREVDLYVRDHRSTAMARAMLDLPADIIGRGWDHLAGLGGRARFHPAIDAATLPALYADTQFLLNTTPNFSCGTHERVLHGFAAKTCVVTNENADMHRRFAALPSYVGVDTAVADLAGQLAALFHGARRYDDHLEPAAALVAAEFSGEAFMRGLIDLALELHAAPAYADAKY